MRTTATPLTRRLATITRLQFANPFTAVWNPLSILALIFGVNYTIWMLADRYGDGHSTGAVVDPETGELMSEAYINNGGLIFLLTYMLIVAVQTMSFTFSYALGHGVTRRDYYLGTSVFFVIISLGYATLTTGLGLIERATDGWGYQAAFFTAEYVGVTTGWELWLILLMLYLLFTFAGAAVATVYVRWRSSGMIAMSAIITACAIGVAWVLTATNNWGTVADAAVSAGALGVVSWTLVVTVGAAVLGYVVLQRATPKSA